jgi:hypothetical protein
MLKNVGVKTRKNAAAIPPILLENSRPRKNAGMAARQAITTGASIAAFVRVNAGANNLKNWWIKTIV